MIGDGVPDTPELLNGGEYGRMDVSGVERAIQPRFQCTTGSRVRNCALARAHPWRAERAQDTTGTESSRAGRGVCEPADRGDGAWVCRRGYRSSGCAANVRFVPLVRGQPGSADGFLPRVGGCPCRAQRSSTCSPTSDGLICITALLLTIGHVAALFVSTVTSEARCNSGCHVCQSRRRMIVS